MRHLLLLAAWVMVFGLPRAETLARGFRPGMMPNGNLNSCANCHLRASGGGQRTSFGEAVRALVSIGGREEFWTPSLAGMDSDGDGATNGEELGDPDGDGVPMDGAEITNPGDPNSKPPSGPGPHGTIEVRPIDDGLISIDGDLSDWPLENFEQIVQQPPAPQGLRAESVDARGDHIVYEFERSGFFNNTETAELTKSGIGDFGVATYFAYDSEAFYILSVFIDEKVRDDRDTTEAGASGFLNDGFEFFVDANGDSEDCASALMFPAFDEEAPNLEDFQVAVSVNANFLPEDGSEDQLGARQGIERSGNPDLIGEVKNGPGGLFRDALDALEGPDIAARSYADLRAAGALNPEILENDAETFAGYVIEQKIPFGFIPEFTPDHAMKYTQFWRDFDNDDDAGGANQSWIEWTQNSNVGCEDGVIEGLFHTATWAALEFVLDPPLFSKDPQNISLARRSNFGTVELPPVVHDFTIPVGNTGNVGTLNIESITISGRDAAHFAVARFPATLGPKEFGEIAVTFDSKGATGSYEAVLEVVNDDEDAEDQRRTIGIRLSAVDPAGPFSHLRLDEAGGTFADSSGNGRGGAASEAAGTVQADQDPLATGRAVRLAEGGTVYIDGATFGSLDSFSVSLWFQADSVAGQGTLVSRGEGGNPVFAVVRTGANASLFVGETSTLATAGDLIREGTKHHVVAVYDSAEGSGKATIYLDGVEAGSLGDPAPLDDFEGAPLWLGSFANQLGFDGVIDDFQYYDRVLSADEVGRLFGNPGDPIRGVEPDPGGGLVAHYTFEGNAEDQVGSNHGTLENGAAFAESFNGSQALALDGEDDYVSTTDLDLDFITIAAWVNASGGGNQAYVVSKNYDGTTVPYSLNVGGNNLGAALDGLGWFRAGWKNSGIGETGDLRGAGWHHVAGTYDGTTLKYFVDGERIASTEEGSGPLPKNDNVMDIGRYLEDNDYFGGLIDNLRIYGVALSEEDIVALYEEEKRASTPPVDLAASVLGDLGFGAGGGFRLSLPDGIMADIEYSTDLIHWEVIATGTAGIFEDVDAARIDAPAGYYRAMR